MDSFENSPEKLNLSSEDERQQETARWEKAMGDAPEFAGEDWRPKNTSEAEGETTGDEAKRNESVVDAAGILNYGLDAAARQIGVETVVQNIKSFDETSTDTPIKDLYAQMGIDTKKEVQDLLDEQQAGKANEVEFRDRMGVAPAGEQSAENARQAIQDMKELISEVEAADDRYNDLREGARAAGKGYFEYAVDAHEKRGLTELFDELNAAKNGEATIEDESEQDEMTEGEIEQDSSEQSKEEQGAEAEKPDEEAEQSEIEQDKAKQDIVAADEIGIVSEQDEMDGKLVQSGEDASGNFINSAEPGDSNYVDAGEAKRL